MIYKREFIEEDTRDRHAGQLRYNEAIREKRLLSDVVNSECAEFSVFLHTMELNGDLERATEHLRAVLDAGCVEQDAEHLTPKKLLDRVTVWRFRSRSFGIVGLAGSGSSAKTGEGWNTVSLRMKVDRSKQRVDTEFFAWNEQVDGQFNETDDPEKFHIVWELARSSDVPRLTYAGFGTNQPYKLEHPHSKSFAHRPRFRVFDRDDREAYRYDVRWKDLGVFDWQWSYIPVKWTGNTAELDFVSLPDGSCLCLSDREIVISGIGNDGLESWRASVEAAGASDMFHRWRASVSIPSAEVVTDSTPDPNLLDFVCQPGRDYVAYFAALNASEVSVASAAELKKLTAPLGTSRAGEYTRIIERACADVFQPEFTAQLPKHMGDLLGCDTAHMAPELAKAVISWRDNLQDQVRRDLYHYGQDAIARMNRLRFAAWIAMEERFGALYYKALDAAMDVLRGNECHGQYLMSLPSGGVEENTAG
ncbi:hypothetical protein WME99_00545 [Sorangium sp. So ce136]|uniref:hypothetical protein n=1 Tax=Sorangium sp. So ce136 TaxID=3133284 RepID=UPI003F1007AE